MTPSLDLEPLLDADEVARLLGVSRRAVYRIDVSKLPRVLVGDRCIRWKPSDVRAYVDRQRCAGAQVVRPNFGGR